LWVTNYADATISKIRIFDFAVVATIPAGSGPQRAIASTNYVWVANTNANTVTRINPVTDAYSDIALTGGTHTPDKIVYLNNHVWVKSRNSLGKLEKINCSTGASAGVYDFESVLGGIIAYESYLYLTWNATSGSRTYFSKVDPADGSIISSVEIDYNSYGYFLYGKRICNVSNEMWVLNNNSHELEIIDLLSFTKTGTVDFGSGYSRAFKYVLGDIWLVFSSGGEVLKINTTSKTIVRRYAIDNNCRAIWSNDINSIYFPGQSFFYKINTNL